MFRNAQIRRHSSRRNVFNCTVLRSEDKRFVQQVNLILQRFVFKFYTIIRGQVYCSKCVQSFICLSSVQSNRVIYLTRSKMNPTGFPKGIRMCPVLAFSIGKISFSHKERSGFIESIGKSLQYLGLFQLPNRKLSSRYPALLIIPKVPVFYCLIKKFK